MILDYSEKLALPDVDTGNHFDALNALARLGEGLFWIHREVAKIELGLRKEAEKDNVNPRSRMEYRIINQ